MAKKAEAKKPAPKKAESKKCPRGEHEWTTPDKDGWQTCTKCGGMRKQRAGEVKPGQARYTYKW